MSDHVLSYAKPRSAMPSMVAWVLIVVASLTTSAVGWMYYNEFFVSYSTDSHCNSMASTLQTFRGQVELFKIQHNDHPPAETALAPVLLGTTNASDTDVCAVDGTLGPYVQSIPVNQINGQGGIANAPGKGIGWVYKVTGDHYELYAVDTAGTGLLSY